MFVVVVVFVVVVAAAAAATTNTLSPHSLGDNGLGGVSDHINATSIDKAVKKIQ